MSGEALDSVGMARQDRPMAPLSRPRLSVRLIGPLLAIGSVAVTATVATLLTPTLNLASLALLFIAPVTFAAARAGLGSGYVAAALAAIAFNFLLVEPRYTFRIADPDNLATTLLLFVIATVVSYFASQLRMATGRAEAVARDERLLARFSQDIAAVEDETHAIERLRAVLADAFSTVVMTVPIGGDLSAIDPSSSLDHAAASWAVTNRETAGHGSGVIAGADHLFAPVMVGDEVVALFSIGDAILPARAPLMRGAVAATAQALGRMRLAADHAALENSRERHALGTALLSSVGHDLRTPLTVILGEARALLAAEPTRIEPPAIVAEAERLRRRIDNLLGMARIEGGAVTVASELIDLADAVASAFDDVAAMVGDRSVVVTLPSDLPLVRADPGLLHHVLLNLIDNAAKFSGPDGPIEVNAHRVVDTVQLTVADHGPGLPPGREHDVFDRFRRFAGSDRTGGSGLGLAIAQAFSRAFGAEVAASNRDGGGAVFTIIFAVPD